MFVTLIGQFCLCSKRSGVRAGVKGCLPEEPGQNKPIRKSCLALNSLGDVLWSLLHHQGVSLRHSELKGWIPNGYCQCRVEVCKFSCLVVYFRESDVSLVAISSPSRAA